MSVFDKVEGHQCPVGSCTNWVQFDDERVCFEHTAPVSPGGCNCLGCKPFGPSLARTWRKAPPCTKCWRDMVQPVASGQPNPRQQAVVVLFNATGFGDGDLKYVECFRCCDARAKQWGEQDGWFAVAPVDVDAF
jgi:hypothetical protein